MRILAIRGCNLASLAGEFEIDLARAPFADAGVFAIVGNTGAGKSTLLDALCVALFDRTPRLTNHSRVVVGRGEDDPGALGAQDARTLLRRGAAMGWAEVDFEGGDARRYRARWSVRRARGQTDGTLQDQQLSLIAIDSSERLGGTKTETLKAIVARLGLSFDQFRRSALLAQGEFAAFLRADGKDRSELLERMTGTEIYSRLSIAAHVKAALAEQTLREGRSSALAIAILDDAARSAAETELALADAAKHAARANLVAAELAARWLAEAGVRARAWQAAQVEHAAAIATGEASALERQELALRRRADKLRPAWEAAARLDRDVALARRDVLALDAATRSARTEHAALEQRRATLAELHMPIRAARIAAKLVERPPPVDATDAWETLARAALPDAAWLVARVALADEIAGWNEVDARFAQHAGTIEAIAASDRALAANAMQHTAQVRARELVAAEHATASAKLGDAQRKTQAFQQRRGLPLDAARKLEDEARRKLLDVERLVAIASGARQAVRAGSELARQLAELDAAAAADAIARGDAEVARSLAATLRTERARVADELRRAAGFEHARTELREGEACPLCGAIEHPWRDRGAFDSMIASAEASLGEVVRDVETSTATLVTLAARDQQRTRERARIAAYHATAVEAAASAFGTWRDHLTTLGELLLVDDPASLAAERLAGEREAAAHKQLEQARDARRQAEAAAKAAADAQAEVQLSQLELDRHAARLGDADRAVVDLDAIAHRLHGERASRTERLAELDASLRETTTRWLAIDASAPSTSKRKRTDDAALDLDRARGRIAELAAAWRSRAERVARADAALASTGIELDRLAREIERIAAEHAARLADATERRDARASELLAAAAALEAARAESGFDVDALQRLLAADAARTEELADRLAVIDRAIERTRAIVDERAHLVTDHERGRPELARSEDADKLVEASAAILAEAEHHAARLAAALAADADARVRRDAALAELALVEGCGEAARVLGAVIGSHDGKLFRSFAQSLTLDGLLAVANAHLEELAPRYQLERVPKHDLELQVIDRDLGADVRSVQSLSGGESFLVSLALALGLSSMSAHDVRVRTLLIDEGFGTLDPATLDSALAVLDALQATGRQVGVISHVPALLDRVSAYVRVVQRGGGRSEVIV